MGWGRRIIWQKNIIPMWVADMDFRAPQPVLDAFQRQIDHGIFGYSTKSAALVEAIIDWNKEQHQFEIDPSTLFLMERLFRQFR